MPKKKIVEVVEPVAKYLEVLLMPNGEVICLGKTVGYTNTLAEYLHDVPKTA